jgi:hypothetical protein
MGKEMNLYVNGTLTINVEPTAGQLRKLIHELRELAGQPTGTILSTKLNIPLAKECVLNFKKIEEKTPTVN